MYDPENGFSLYRNDLNSRIMFDIDTMWERRDPCVDVQVWFRGDRVELFQWGPVGWRIGKIAVT